MKNLKVKDTTWDLSVLLKSDKDATIKDAICKLEEANKSFVIKWKGRKDYLSDPKVLKEALDEYEKLSLEFGVFGDVGYYFWLRSNQDQLDKKIKARLNKLEELEIELANNISFFTHRLSKVSSPIQKTFLSDKGLIDYTHFLKRLFDDAKYLLSEKEEKILNLTSKSSHSNWVSMVSEFISKEERKTLNEKKVLEVKNFSELMNLISDKNKKVRDMAVDHVNNILLKYVDVAEHEINSILEDKKMRDKLRKIKRPDLTRHLSDDIDSEVVDGLVSSVQSRKDISARYYELKAKLLGLKKLEYHERNIEYGSLDMEYPYQNAVNLTATVFNNLDPQFFSILKVFVDENRIDVYPKKGKSGGAFCVSILKSKPDYILLNYGNKFRDVTTLAHEMGHAINNELMRKQNALNYDTPLSVAEVSSTFFEDFVLDEMEKSADDEMKLSIMMMRLNDSISSIHRQVACYAFEKELHESFREKGYLSKTDIGKIFQKHMSDYMGGFVIQSKGFENWWVYWGHIRRFFYVYSYASGLLISKSLQNMIKKDAKFIDKVKEFLSAGTSKSPKDIFLDLGIDITKKEFWNKGLDEIDQLLTEAEVLAKKLNKI